MTKVKESLADALGRAHAALLKDLKEISAAARSRRRAGATAWRQRLEALQTHITQHFCLEEENGYMTEVLKRKPHYKREVDELLDEHRELFQSLSQLIAELNDPSAPDLVWRKQVLGWIAQIRKHERRENDLVQDAFNLDISAED
jgi:hypothetical protein